MCSLAYERAWYAKLGGCIAIKFLVERMSLRWVLEHQFIFLKALLFVMMDLTGEVRVDLCGPSLPQIFYVPIKLFSCKYCEFWGISTEKVTTGALFLQHFRYLREP